MKLLYVCARAEICNRTEIVNNRHSLRQNTPSHWSKNVLQSHRLKTNAYPTTQSTKKYTDDHQFKRHVWPSKFPLQRGSPRKLKKKNIHRSQVLLSEFLVWPHRRSIDRVCKGIISARVGRPFPPIICMRAARSRTRANGTDMSRGSIKGLSR